MPTSTTQEKLDNAAVAERMEAYAALLDLAGASFYTARAYRRAAELIRSLPAPVAQLVAAGRVRELRGIGPGIEARLRELVETGDIAELRELEESVSPELVGFGRLLGISPKRTIEITRALGVRTTEEFRAAARDARLQEVPGIGPDTERRMLEALERETGARSGSRSRASPSSSSSLSASGSGPSSCARPVHRRTWRRSSRCRTERP